MLSISAVFLDRVSVVGFFLFVLAGSELTFLQSNPLMSFLPVLPESLV